MAANDDRVSTKEPTGRGEGVCVCGHSAPRHAIRTKGPQKGQRTWCRVCGFGKCGVFAVGQRVAPAYVLPPAPVAPAQEAARKCMCGENSPDRLVVHRTDGPCYLRGSDQPTPSPGAPTPEPGARRFRKKPVVIEAEQFWPEKQPWPTGVEPAKLQHNVPGDRNYWPAGSPVIRTLEGSHHVSPGDWIITGVKGERYPCKPDIFEATYEPAEPASPNAATEPARLQCAVSTFPARQCTRDLGHGGDHEFPPEPTPEAQSGEARHWEQVREWLYYAEADLSAGRTLAAALKFKAIADVYEASLALRSQPSPPPTTDEGAQAEKKGPLPEPRPSDYDWSDRPQPPVTEAARKLAEKIAEGLAERFRPYAPAERAIVMRLMADDCAAALTSYAAEAEQRRAREGAEVSLRRWEEIADLRDALSAAESQLREERKLKADLQITYIETCGQLREAQAELARLKARVEE